jgi:GNAT superfamily N-acetyltransferase
MTELRFEEIENGAVARRGGEEAARLTGRLGDDAFGRHAWIDWSGEPGLLPQLYALAAEPWVRDDRRAHYVEVRADDAAAVETWFGLAFGRQQVYAERPTAGAEPYDGPVVVRLGGPDDLDVAVSMADLIFRHHNGPPVWSSAAYDGTREEWDEFLREPQTTYFLAELDGVPVAHLALRDRAERPDDEVYLAIGATRAEARGRGAMRALTAAALAWAEEHGYRVCETDWRSTNPQSSSFWTHRGFRPTRYRLHRLVGH